MPGDEASLGDQQTFEGGAQPADSAKHSLGDQSTFGDDDGSSWSDFGEVSPDADFDMEVADLSARYTIDGSPGIGGMGEVLLATDTRLKRQVAIKRVRGEFAKSQVAVRRFLTEAQSIAALNHLNIVQIYDYGRDKDGPFLIMEYVDGGSLLDRCREGAIPVDEAIELTCQLCDGLGKAHDAGIIHRDIKPANVLLTGEGVPKLTDFGLAKDETADAGLSVAGAVLGTLDFMPPEQRRDSALTDSRSDLWSLAATLYQMVTGEPPRVIDLDAVPQQLRTSLAKELKLNQDDRYQAAWEFRDALRASQQDNGTGGELLEGECPQCRTRNEPSRNFCRGCGGALQAECFSCSVTVPMWEVFCGECGTNQTDLLEERRTRMASNQSEAESLLRSYDFDRATELATALGDEQDPRLQHLKGWVEDFLTQIEQGREQQLERVGGQLTEAATHEQVHDYAAGLRVLEQVPKTLRETQVSGHSDTVTGVMNRLQSTLEETQCLDREIRQRLETRKLNGLQNAVDQLLALQPGRKGLTDLRARLKQRDDKIAGKVSDGLEKVKALRQRCRFEAALKRLEKMPEDVGLLSSEINDLGESCGQLASQQEAAMRAVEAASEPDLPPRMATGYESDIRRYRVVLVAESLEDQKFLSVCDSAAAKLRELRGAEEQKQKLKLVAAAVAAVVLLIAAGLWVRSSIRARSLASAIERQSWEEALQIDGQHVLALTGRANQRLNAAVPDIAGAFADLRLAELVDSTVSELKPVKALA